MKNIVLELYLNYIPFGNNAFGVEAASKTYFSKSAKDLDVLEASILASIPKGPSVYNPYKNRKAVVGEFVVTDGNGVKIPFTGDIAQKVIDTVTTNLNAVNLDSKNKNNELMDALVSA
jgi:membrane peptidoglycan carboxypeptidase